MPLIGRRRPKLPPPLPHSRSFSSSSSTPTYTLLPPPLPHQPKPPALKRCVALLQTCTSLARLKQIHAHSIRHGVPASDPDLSKHLIFFTVSLSLNPMPYAGAVFSQVADPNIFTLNTMIRGHAESDDPYPAIWLHRQMVSKGVPPDTHTYPFLLKACAKVLELREGEKVHGLAVRNGNEASVFVQNALVHLYGACGYFDCAYRVFDRMSVRNLVTWNSVINGFAVNGRPNEALTLFRDMSAVEGEERVEPDGFTIVSLLCASAELGALALGRRAHVFLFKVGLDGIVHLGNALIDLYAKCGSIWDAHRVFDEMGARNVVSWTSLIVGLAVNGSGREAIKLFGEMERDGLQPTVITLVGVLYACSHCGWVNEGFRYFHKMQNEYKLVPKIEHYGCMVDLLGRAGNVEDAYRLIIKMPLEPNAIVWRALLGACSMHKRLALAEIVWAQLEQLDPGHSGDYVLLSNLYASRGRWVDVHNIRKRMLRGGVKKTPGYSLIELGNRVHEFTMGDQSHPETDAIYGMLKEIAMRLNKVGYIAQTTNVLADIEEEEKETALLYHSERLAIAYALLKTAHSVPIRIVKNLRVCEDCHLVTKLISKVYGREIIVRDRSRFHHFNDGLCSCKDYW